MIADNCTDDTAAVAAAAGAEVIVRNDPRNIGKGFALDFGVRHLDSDPRDIVIIIDADCRLSDGAINALAGACARTQRPAQALDLMTSATGSGINHRVAEFAWRIKNWVRPLGLSNLGLPCQLMGTGMAFPWSVIRAASLASGHLVEDLRLGLDLARAGTAAQFCPSAVVTSEFPETQEGVQSQRRRWERGHLQMIAAIAPRYFYVALTRGNWELLALVLDLSVPPLSLLALLVLVAAAGAIGAALVGSSFAAVIISAAAFAAFGAAIVLSWQLQGRQILPLQSLPSIVPYVLGKLRLYAGMLLHRSNARWIRTDRKPGG